MLAVVDDGVGAELVAQPEIEGEVGVRRHEVGVVVGGGRVDLVAAGGLEADDDVAEAVEREAEGVAVDEGVGFGGAPVRGDGVADRGGEAGEGVAVGGERQGDAGRGWRGGPSGRRRRRGAPLVA